MYYRIINGSFHQYSSFAQVREAFPHTSFPDAGYERSLAELGVFPIDPTPPPPYSSLTHTLVEADPVEIAGQWTQQWALVPHEIEIVRAELHDRRRAKRTEIEISGFIFNEHPIDSDRDSILRIANAALTATIANLTEQSFYTEWHCADGYNMPLDAQGMLNLQIALSSHGQICHSRSMQISEMIESATSLDQLNSILDEIKSW